MLYIKISPCFTYHFKKHTPTNHLNASNNTLRIRSKITSRKKSNVGRNKPALAGVSGKVSRVALAGYAGNARDRAYSGLRFKEVILDHILNN